MQFIDPSIVNHTARASRSRRRDEVEADREMEGSERFADGARLLPDRLDDLTARPPSHRLTARARGPVRLSISTLDRLESV